MFAIGEHAESLIIHWKRLNGLSTLRTLH